MTGCRRWRRYTESTSEYFTKGHRRVTSVFKGFCRHYRVVDKSNTRTHNHPLVEITTIEVSAKIPLKIDSFSVCVLWSEPRYKEDTGVLFNDSSNARFKDHFKVSESNLD